MPKSGNFNLKELLSQRSLQKEGQQDKERQEEELESVTVDVYDLIPSEDNFYSTEHIEDLKQSIRVFGVLQPLLVKTEGGKYIVRAGHCRRQVCMELVEEGEEWARRVPCVIKQQPEEAEPKTGIEKILDKLTLIAANKFREKTEWEKMEETLQQEELISELKKETDLPGRVRSMLADFSGVKEAQIGRYKAIKNNLCPELMEEFKADNIGMTIIYETSGLSSEYQKEAFEIFRENGILTGADVKALKAREEKEKQIPGQIKWPEETEAEERKGAIEEQHKVTAEVEQQAAIEEEPEQEEEEEEPEKESEEEEPVQPETAPLHGFMNESEQEETRPEAPQVVYVRQEAQKQHGCGFCHLEHHREISTQQGNFLLAYEPETKLIQILSKETGSIETIIFHKCPMCGRDL